MNDYIEQQLNRVLELNNQRQISLKTISNNQTKRVGQYLMQVSDEEKQAMTQKTNRLYDSKIKAIYDNVNLELKRAGQETLINPFERG
jgi:hypothetical protein